jgi:hypothetical protein
LRSSARLRAVPAWAWLVAIVAASTVFRAVLARGMPGPFIFVDELIYSELAKSFASGGHFLVRDVPTSGYGIVYPAVISPAYRLFDDLPLAYAGVKTINSLAMSLAAVPAYLLARRMMRMELALLAALITVAVPSMVYTGTVMTENVFYGLFLLVSLALVAVLDRPTLGRHAALLVLIVVAYLTRAQSVAFLPAVVVAPFLLAFLERKPLRSAWRRFATLYWIVGAGAVVVVVAQVARGRSIGSLLGAYSVVGDQSYSVRQVADFALWHAADLSLYVGVIPLAASILVVARARRESRAVQAFVAAAVPLTVSFTVVVAAFATHFASDRIHERNLFQVTPLLFIGLLVWVGGHDRGAPRNWPLLAGATAVSALVPLTIPYDRFIGDPARADTLALLPLWTINQHFLAGSVRLTVGLVCGGMGALLLLVPRRAGLALPVIVLAWFALLMQPVWSGPQGFERSSAGAVFQGIRGVDRDWIDDTLPGVDVPVLWSGPPPDRFVVNQNEFFNRDVGQVYYTSAPTDGGLYEKRIHFDRRGYARTADGRLVRFRYLLGDGGITPDGTVVALDDAGATLWRLQGPLFSTTSVQGLYPHDSWSGKHVVWTRRRCRGGVLRVTLNSGPELFSGSNRVVATTGARKLTRIVPRLGLVTMRVPLPSAASTCVVRFTVAKTLVPNVVTNGRTTDKRLLGAHFDVFQYVPAR